MKKYLLVIVVLLAATASQAQPNYNGALVYSFPHIPRPYITSDMPLDVVIGYILADSVARSTSVPVVDSAVLTLQDTGLSRWAMKYWYQMDDYDPVRFSQWIGTYGGTVNYQTSPGYAWRALTGRLQEVAKDTGRSLYLCYSDLIAHVRVTSRDTMTTPGNHPKLRRMAEKVSVEVIDTIKGRVFPSCEEGDNLQSGTNYLVTPSCLQFEYRWDWSPSGIAGDYKTSSKKLATSYDSSWINLDQEYIVFLGFVSLGSDQYNDYATIMPAFGATTMAGMYPIVNGIVQDPNNDFGFGNNLSPQLFKAALRQKIDSIVNP